jgi:hypothetical protein
MSKYEVPASIKIEVQKALITWWKNNNEEIMLPRDILYVVNVVSESFAAALAENPITPTDKQAEELWRHLNGNEHYAKAVARDWQRMVFATAERPPVDDLVSESWTDLGEMTIGEALDEWPRRIRKVADEAYKRGQNSK